MSVMAALLLAGVLTAAAQGGPTAVEPGAETVKVTATGESAISWSHAEEKALRNAVRQGAGVWIDSQSHVRDFELRRDTIYARARGYVLSYEVARRRRGLDDTFVVEVDAVVSTGRVKDDFLRGLVALIELKGRPAFAVKVLEDPKTQVPCKDYVETAIYKFLQEHGHAVLHSETASRALDREVALDILSGAASAERLRLQLGAPYGVVAKAVCETEEREGPFGLGPQRFTAVTLTFVVVARDTGGVGAAMNASCERASTTPARSAQAAAQCAVDSIAMDVLYRLFENWSRELDKGLKLAVRCDALPYEVVSRLASELREIDGVESAHILEAEAGLAKIELIARLSAEDLANVVRRLCGGELRASILGPSTVRVYAAGPRAVAAEEATDKQTDYVLPAAILGACILIGIFLAAMILGKGKQATA